MADPSPEDPGKAEGKPDILLLPLTAWASRYRLICIWMARRGLSGIAQILGVVAVIYLFFDVLSPGSAPSSPGGFLSGWATLAADLFTGRWGTVQLGAGLTMPTLTYVSYFLPWSIELAALALGISFLLAYPWGLLSGWRRGRLLDGLSQGYIAVWLIVPTIMLCLLSINALYVPFINYTGDTVNSLFETLPSTQWFTTFTGQPSPPWIGQYGQTLPTGFPVLDAALNRDWAAEWIILLKLLLDAAIIAVTYVAIFLRYARGATSEVVQSSHLRVGRSLGIPERSLLWHHTGRRLLPLYVFTLGNTFGSFIVIQSVVEFLFDTHGALYLLLDGAGVALLGGGIHSQEDLVIVLIFLIALVILLVNIMGEAVAMALDPTWLGTDRSGGRLR